MLVEGRQRDVAEQRGENPPLWGAGDGVPPGAILGQDAGLEERLDQRQDALVGDPSAHAVHQGRMVDLVEAGRDVPLQDPLIGAGGQVVDLGNGVLGAASGAKAVGAGLEVRLEDRLQYQLQRGLDRPVACGGDPKGSWGWVDSSGSPVILQRARA
jgi:hypothetical protein